MPPPSSDSPRPRWWTGTWTCTARPVRVDGGVTRTPAGPWTFEGSVASLGSPGETVTLVEETTFCLSDRCGDIVADSTHGLVLLETRFVSELRLLVDGEAVEPLGTAVEQPSAAVFYGRVAGSGVLGEAPLVVRRSRRIGRGMVDVVRVEHHGWEHRIVEVTMCLAADFASVFEVKERRRTVATVVRAEAEAGTLRFVGERNGRSSALRAGSDAPATTELRGSSGRFTWQLELPPRSSTEVCLEITCETGGVPVEPRHRCGMDPSTSEPERRLGAWRATAPILRTDDDRLRLAIGRGIEDLGALTLPTRTIPTTVRGGRRAMVHDAVRPRLHCSPPGWRWPPTRHWPSASCGARPTPGS